MEAVKELLAHDVQKPFRGEEKNSFGAYSRLLLLQLVEIPAGLKMRPAW